MLPMMCMEGTMWGLGGVVKATLRATGATPGGTNVPLTAAQSRALAGPNVQSVNHFIMSLCIDTTLSTQRLKWVCVCKERCLLA